MSCCTGLAVKRQTSICDTGIKMYSKAGQRLESLACLSCILLCRTSKARQFRRRDPPADNPGYAAQCSASVHARFAIIAMNRLKAQQLDESRTRADPIYGARYVPHY